MSKSSVRSFRATLSQNFAELTLSLSLSLRAGPAPTSSSSPPSTTSPPSLFIAQQLLAADQSSWTAIEGAIKNLWDLPPPTQPQQPVHLPKNLTLLHLHAHLRNEHRHLFNSSAEEGGFLGEDLPLIARWVWRIFTFVQDEHSITLCPTPNAALVAKNLPNWTELEASGQARPLQHLLVRAFPLLAAPSLPSTTPSLYPFYKWAFVTLRQVVSKDADRQLKKENKVASNSKRRTSAKNASYSTPRASTTLDDTDSIAESVASASSRGGAAAASVVVVNEWYRVRGEREKRFEGNTLPSGQLSTPLRLAELRPPPYTRRHSRASSVSSTLESVQEGHAVGEEEEGQQDQLASLSLLHDVSCSQHRLRRLV